MMVHEFCKKEGYCVKYIFQFARITAFCLAGEVLAAYGLTADGICAKIREALANLDGRAAKAILDSEGKLSFDFGEGPVELTADDLLIETTQREGFYTVSDRDITVAIDTVLTPALIEEGFMREIISKVQTMRKEAGFEVTDHIRITMEGSEKVTAVAEAKKAEITGATLAESLTVGTPVGYTKEWDLNGEKATLGVEKI